MKTIIPRLLSFILLFSGFSVQAQVFEWEAQIQAPVQAGFYSIPLPSQVLAWSQASLADVRIYGNGKTEVAYVLKKDQFVFDKSHFVEYPVESKEIKKGCCTDIVLRNDEVKNLSNFCLIVKNHEVVKKATLSGSDDKTNWYALREDVVLEPLNNAGQTFGTCQVYFPLSNYRYFLLHVEDSSTAPLNILQIGFYNSEQNAGKFVPVPAPLISQADSAKAKRTYVHLKFDAPYVLDKMELTFEGSKFFSRTASFYACEYDAKKRRQLVFLQSFHISSKSSSYLEFGSTKSREYVIEIENGDSPPLRLKSVKAEQLNTYLLTYLEPGVPYSLKFGNKEVSFPQYDLSAFEDSVPVQLPELEVSQWMKATSPMVASTEKSFFQTKAWIWGAIVLVIGFLGWMSVGMLKELGKGK